MDITKRLRGKTLESVATNGHLLLLQFSDGSEATIFWADAEGRVLKGKPVLLATGVRLVVRGVSDLINLPATYE